MTSGVYDRLLFSDQLAPLTSEIGFIEAPTEVVVRQFLDWQRPVQQQRKVSVRERTVEGSLDGMLATLAPLTVIEARRYLFVPTRSEWVAYFENSAQGADASSAMSVLSRLLGCRTLRIAYVPDSRVAKGKSASGRFGAVAFEIYSPEGEPPRNLRRSISLVNDGGEWVFETFGDPLPFEDESAYASRDLRERFSLELLLAYAGEVGVRPFDQSFYCESGAVLVEKEGPRAPGDRDVSLEDARPEM